MSSSSKRINLSVSGEKYELLKDLADERGTSMSQLVEEFMDVGMELFEDVGLSEIAEERLEEEPDEWLSLDEL
jgi:predicted DNA-binding protein